MCINITQLRTTEFQTRQVFSKWCAYTTSLFRTWRCWILWLSSPVSVPWDSTETGWLTFPPPAVTPMGDTNVGEEDINPYWNVACSSRENGLVSSGLITPEKFSIESTVSELDHEGKERICQKGKWEKPQLMGTPACIGTVSACISTDHEINRQFYWHYFS